MTAVLSGFAVIFLVIAAGYLLGRTGVLGAAGQQVITRLVFYLATPALLIDVVSRADPAQLFSAGLGVAAGSAVVVGAAYALFARTVWRRPWPETTVGALSASYLNGGNLGIPIAVFVLGDAALVAPVMLFQIILYAPVALTVLDVTTTGRAGSTAQVARSIVANPIVWGGVIGLALSLTGTTAPGPLGEAVTLVGGAAVPGALVAFGLSLAGARILERGVSPRRDVALAAVGKALVQPAVAYLLARFGFGLAGGDLLAVVVVAALPTAQNVFVYASRYGRGEVLARDTGLVTTVAAVPIIAGIAAVLG